LRRDARHAAITPPAQITPTKQGYTIGLNLAPTEQHKPVQTLTHPNWHQHQVDDDEPRPPELSPLDSPQSRRADRQAWSPAPPWSPALRDWLSRRG
jgi:hypothetical protein